MSYCIVQATQAASHLSSQGDSLCILRDPESQKRQPRQARQLARQIIRTTRSSFVPDLSSSSILSSCCSFSSFNPFTHLHPLNLSPSSTTRERYEQHAINVSSISLPSILPPALFKLLLISFMVAFNKYLTQSYHSIPTLIYHSTLVLQLRLST